MPRTGRAAAAGCALALALGCGPAPERLRVATVRQPATSLFFAAEAAGCFARERLEIEERTFDLGRDAIPLLRDGWADVAVAYEAVVVRAAQADPRMRVLSTLHHSSRNTRLVTRHDRGVERFADLAGKRVGVARGTNADFFVELVLRFAGIPRSSVDVVDLSPDASADALAAGQLDAAVLSDPHAARAERALGDAASVLHTDLYVEFSLLTTRDDVVAARAPALRALLRGLACGERFARQRPAEELARLERRLPHLDRAALEAQLARVERGLGLDHVLVHALRREHAWFLPGVPEPTALLEPRLLEAIDPEAVTLLPLPKARR